MKVLAKSAILVAAILLLTGCGSSSNPIPTPTPTPSVTPSSTPTPTPTPTATTAALVCDSSQLSIILGAEGAAMGSRGVTGTAFKNISSMACRLKGYPIVQMIDGTGKSIPTYVTRTETIFGTPTPVKLLTLLPGAEAKFDMLYEAQTGYGNLSCPTSTSVNFTPPGSSTALVLNWKIQPYGGTVQALKCGELKVSPLYAP